MNNQHRKIKGYRELTQEEIDLMNQIKEQGVALETLHGKVKAHIGRQRSATTTIAEEIDRLNAAEPERFAALAKTEFQTALMYLTRAVAQPTFF